MEDYFNNHDVLNDIRRLKKNHKDLGNEWDVLKDRVEDKRIQPDYQRMLRLVLGKADEMYQQPQRKRKRDNNITTNDIDDEDDELEHEERRRKMKHCAKRLDDQRGPNVRIRACDKGKNVVGGDHDEVSRIYNEGLYQEQNRNVGVDQDRPVTKKRLGMQRRVRWKDLVDGDNEDTMPKVRVDSQNLSRENGPGNNPPVGKRVVDQVRPSKKDNGLLRRKNVRLDGRNVKAQSSRKRAPCDIRDARVEKSSNKGGDDDVEILDDDAFRAVNSFVPSKTFHDESMESDENMDFHHVGSMNSASDAFRKQVVDVLKKPFDKEELKTLRKDVQDGSYYRHFPDLKKKLARSRNKRGKCLNILRGFLFWVQNVAQEGAFEPWRDSQCLAVMPRSPENFPPPQSTNLNRAKESKQRKILK
ncbi:hypothetical protein PHJA_001966400 [Phtheirospermum japonicum]|uniref:Uncharacterized protein n=1 Tax=Phtheirospermum japonicum TaxID=374723 RepID=A0A830CQ07_9LAMI|nr:hypothetical protein PHJA_001966400 [Phtheirospermum japonicum]